MATVYQAETTSETSNTQGDMRIEMDRLATFGNWPTWAPKSALTLAENGFSYIGPRDKVVCFSCGGHISNWTKDDNVSYKHRQMFPECIFAQGKDRTNVAMNIDHSLGGKIRKTDIPGKQSLQTTETTHEHHTASGAASVPVASSGVVSNGSIEDTEELFAELRSLGPPGAQNRATVVTNSVPQANPEAVPQGPISLDEPSRAADLDDDIEIADPDVSLVKHERYRLRTFVGKWSDHFFVSPADLAKAGFYFLSTPDRVQCAFCRGRLLNWRPSDVPMPEHRKHFPRCPFVRGEEVGNVPLEESLKTVQFPAKPQKENVATELLGIVTGRAKHARYSLETTRMESFDTWPENHPLSREILAKAGFFYIGYSDNVKCFYCDGGLRNWEAGDDPWREHARWFSRCGFLQLSKGEDYIQEILNETTSEGNCLNPRVRQLRDKSHDKDVSKSMDTPMVKAVLNMGFSGELVRQVILTHRSSTGRDFVGAEDLFEAVLGERKRREEATLGEQPQTQGGHVEQQPDEQQQIEEPQASSRIVKEQEPGHINESASPTDQTQSQRRRRNRTKKDKKNAAAKQSREKPTVTTSEKINGKTVPSGETSPIRTDKGVQELVKEYQRIKEERTCKICMNDECTVVFLPCGHLVCCSTCAPALRSCPICRTLIKGSVRISEMLAED